MISAVIPILNECETLESLHAELDGVAVASGLELDIVFVDDGSSDRSWEVITRLSMEDDRVRGIRFRRNFGKAAALDAGFRAAVGDLVITLDGDLQDDPREIPRLLAKIDEGFDLVSGWKATSTGRYRASASGERRYPCGVMVKVITYALVLFENSRN